MAGLMYMYILHVKYFHYITNRLVNYVTGLNSK